MTQTFLFNNTCKSQVFEKCDLAVFISGSTKYLDEECIQSTSKLPVWNEDNSKLMDSDLEEIFSGSEFEDEEVLALSDRGMKISKALTNRVDAFLSDEDQVKSFIDDLMEEEYFTADEDDDSDVEFFDAEESLDSDNEELLYDYGSTMVSQIQADNDDDFLVECCHLIAMTQPEENDQCIVADIYKMCPKMADVEELSRHKSIEDTHESIVPQLLLRSLSMMQFDDATNSDVENHAAKALVVCDSSRFTANSIKMSDDQRIDGLVTKVKSPLDVQEGQLAESLDVPSQCSSVSACIGSSSGELVLDRLENTKSELIPNNLQELVFDVTEENDEDGIWSILTDNLYYLGVQSSFDTNPIKFQNPEMKHLTQRKDFSMQTTTMFLNMIFFWSNKKSN